MSRYEKLSTVLTSNRVDDFSKLLGDVASVTPLARPGNCMKRVTT